MSVCFVAPLAWPVLARDPAIPVVGGAEVQQAILARLFAAHGHRVSMITLDFGQPDGASIDGVRNLKAYEMRDGIPVLRFLYPRLTSMWRALKEADADIYYSRSVSMWLGVIASFCRRRGRRVIYAGASNKDFVPGQAGQISYARDRWLFRRGLAAADAIVVQNEVQRATCKAHYGRDAVLIPSCYERPGKAAEPEGLVLWVGTVHDNKRPQLLLELAARLPRLRFVMIGGPGADKAFYERIRGRARELPNVEFKGFLPLAEVEPWFDRARVLVNTSRFEGTPNTFLQAWARGIPTVGTVDVGAHVHRVAPDLESLTREIEDVLENPAFGAACRRYFERTHSKSEVMARYQRLFERLAA